MSDRSEPGFDAHLNQLFIERAMDGVRIAVGFIAAFALFDVFANPDHVAVLFALKAGMLACCGLLWVTLRRPGLSRWVMNATGACVVAIALLVAIGSVRIGDVWITAILCPGMGALSATLLPWSSRHQLLTAIGLAACAVLNSVIVAGEPSYAIAGSVTFLLATPYVTSIKRTTELALFRHDRELRYALEASKLARERAEEAASARATFLATMSHELRTPMNGVLGMSEVLLRSELTEEQRDKIETIRASGDALLAMIDDVLDLSKLEAGKVRIHKEPVKIRRLLRRTLALVQPLADDRGLELSLEVGDAVPEALSLDGSRVRQVLTNLVGNALKFTEKGFVRVEVEVDAEPSDAEEEGADGARRGGPGALPLVLRVVDSGIGIAPGSPVFDAFTQLDQGATRRFGGAGLGLAISRRLAEAMGGELSFNAREGGGTVFSFRFPAMRLRASAPSIPDTDPGTSDAPGARPSLAILLAEDQPVNQQVARLMLEQLGHVRVDTVEDGAAALERAEGGAYDVILMDIQMPRMDGLEATRAVRSLDLVRQPYIIALTANAMPSDEAACREAGVDDYLPKPLTIPALSRAMRRAETRYASGEFQPAPRIPSPELPKR